MAAQCFNNKNMNLSKVPTPGISKHLSTPSTLYPSLPPAHPFSTTSLSCTTPVNISTQRCSKTPSPQYPRPLWKTHHPPRTRSPTPIRRYLRPSRSGLVKKTTLSPESYWGKRHADSCLCLGRGDKFLRSTYCWETGFAIRGGWYVGKWNKGYKFEWGADDEGWA